MLSSSASSSSGTSAPVFQTTTLVSYQHERPRSRLPMPPVLRAIEEPSKDELDAIRERIAAQNPSVAHIFRDTSESTTPEPHRDVTVLPREMRATRMPEPRTQDATPHPELTEIPQLEARAEERPLRWCPYDVHPKTQPVKRTPTGIKAKRCLGGCGKAFTRNTNRLRHWADAPACRARHEKNVAGTACAGLYALTGAEVGTDARGDDALARTLELEARRPASTRQEAGSQL